MNEQIQLTKPNESTRNPFNRSLSRCGFLLSFAVASFGISPLLQAIDISPDGGDSSGCVAPPDGLVSWWSGDRTADDLQGTNNGTLVNGTSFTKGMVGPAFRFDGVDDYVQIPHNASLNPEAGDFSVDFWMNTATSGNLALLSKREACGPVSFWSLSIEPDGHPGAELFSGGSNSNVIFSDIPVNDGTWHHIALVRQTTTATLYIDGAVHGSGSTEEIVIVRNNEPLLFGTDVCVGANGRQVYSGELDEIEYFNVALTSSQVADIYNAGSAGQCKPEIFVSSIDPSYRTRGPQFLISTSVKIQDINGVGIKDARVKIKTTFPDGQVLSFAVTTDQTGLAILTFSTTSTGLYTFTVQKVTQSGREYDPSLNIETTDTLVIP